MTDDGTRDGRALSPPKSNDSISDHAGVTPKNEQHVLRVGRLTFMAALALVIFCWPAAIGLEHTVVGGTVFLYAVWLGLIVLLGLAGRAISKSIRSVDRETTAERTDD